MSKIDQDMLGDRDDVSITYEDQKNINNFAKLNAKLEDIKETLKMKQNDMKNIEEACDELSLADDEDGKISYLLGDIFVCQTVEETLKRLEDAKTEKINEIKNLESQSESIKSQMTELKAHLYGKFASKINLESEDD